MVPLGCVPYLNAKPLVWALEAGPLHGLAQISYDVPSKLRTRLDDDGAHAVLVSSVEALRHPAARVAFDVGISSRGEVKSVRLFSKVPFDKVRTLALDQSSVTSNLLAQLVLRERYQAHPETEHQPPNLEEMLDGHDAAVLIGDIGMQAEGSGLEVLDLGEAWTRWTGRPFVWALWVGGSKLDRRLSAMLSKARELGESHTEQVLDWALAGDPLDRDRARQYLTEVMDYRLSGDHIEALLDFARRLEKSGLVQGLELPRVVPITRRR